MPSVRSVTALVVAASIGISLILTACIERSNPFDPANSRTVAIEDVRKGLKPTLDSLAAAALAIARNLDGYREGYRRDSLANAAVDATNREARAANASLESANAAIGTANAAQADAALLRTQSYYALLDTMAAYGPYSGLDAEFETLQKISLRAAAIMATANANSAPAEAYPAAYRDSLLGPMQRDSAAIARLQADIGSGNLEVAAYNRDIQAYNAFRKSANDAVRDFNRVVEFQQQISKQGVITHADTLLKKSVSATAGDTLLLGPGTFTLDLRFNSGNIDNPIVIRGYPGWKTILKPRMAADSSVLNQAALLDNNKYIRIEDVVFRGGAISGVKLSQDSRGVSFRRCLFDSSRIWGVDASGSDLELIDCEIRANGGGIRVEAGPDSDYRLRLHNVLIAGNRGAGIVAVAPLGVISNTTIADNSGSGIRIDSHLRTLNINNSIFSGNGGFGIDREQIEANQEGLTVTECDLWRNTAGNWNLPLLDSARAKKMIGDNLEVDPRFANPAGFDYAPLPGSRLDEYETQSLPVVIGYRRKP